MTQILTIGELEQLTGYSRGTIYFYVREGLVPPPQKSGRGRGLYSDYHVRALSQIQALKEQGLTLSEIRRNTEAEADSSAAPIDLVARLTQETRGRILETAIRHFARMGYRGARMADIIAELGMAPLIFYRYFPTKRQLFLEAVDVFSDWMLELVEPQVEREDDFVRRQMLRANAFLGLLALSPDLLTFIRAEAMTHGGESRVGLQLTYRKMLQPVIDDLNKLGREHGRPSTHEDELMAYAFMGVLEDTAMRLSWDTKYSQADYYWANLTVILGIERRYREAVDIRSDPSLASLVDELVERKPPVPPRFLNSLQRP